jgi:zinc transport system ATP-binding protein
MIIEFDNVSFSYETHHVLKNISLKVQKGEFLALIGSNGTGKTTILKLILDELKPNSGKIKLFNEDIKHFKDWTKISYLAQNASALVSHFPTTVYELVSSHLHPHLGFLKILTKEDKQKVNEVLKIVGMEKYKKHLFSKLSGGQMQKVLLARAIISEPEILILDEPTSALDEKSTVAFYELLRKLANINNTSVIMSTHDQVKCFQYCHHIVNLDDEYLKEARP